MYWNAEAPEKLLDLGWLNSTTSHEISQLRGPAV
jgi:hypothetical protein